MLMRDRKKRPVLENALADGTMAARSPNGKLGTSRCQGSFQQNTPIPVLEEG
jgi:hypothetical protein